MSKLKKVIEYSKKLKLLYVEDNENVRNITTTLFDSFFAEVVVGVDGEDGYEKFSLGGFDLIITDINMPKLTGLEMIEKIRKTDLDIPILVLSAYSDSNFMMDSIKLGVEGYILKPIIMDQFLQLLDKTIARLKVSRQIDNEKIILLKTMDKYIISSETDTKGIITNVSEAFCDVSGYTKEELIGQSHSIVRSTDMPKSIFIDLWQSIKLGNIWKGEIKNLRKNGTYYWLHTVVSPKFTENHESNGYTAISHDITDKKVVENLTQNLELKVQERTKELDIARKQAEDLYKHIRDSINYAALIQGAVVSQASEIKPFFKDSFVHWIPKDTVGGDIWLFNELRHKDECLLMFIDCTGHGVPGAFVTMIVKAVEREIIASLKKHTEFDISPAVIMAHFNKTMKLLLKQETKDSISNAGWDGGIIYYNRRTQILKFAGAETPLFYTTTDGELKTVKGNRYSVGYKKCSMDYEYKETILEVEEGMKFYCTTDGYLDQNGGVKDFPFGKRRFGNIIKENYTETMANQKEIFIDEMTKYEAFIEDNDRNDDMTLIAFEIGEKVDFKEDTKKRKR